MPPPPRRHCHTRTLHGLKTAGYWDHAVSCCSGLRPTTVPLFASQGTNGSSLHVPSSSTCRVLRMGHRGQTVVIKPRGGRWLPPALAACKLSYPITILCCILPSSMPTTMSPHSDPYPLIMYRVPIVVNPRIFCSYIDEIIHSRYFRKPVICPQLARICDQQCAQSVGLLA